MVAEETSRNEGARKGKSEIDLLYEEWQQRYGERGKVSAEAHLAMGALLLGCKMHEVVERANELIEKVGLLERQRATNNAQIHQLTQRLVRLEKLLELLSHNVESLPDSVVHSMIWRGIRIGTSRPKEDDDSILP